MPEANTKPDLGTQIEPEYFLKRYRDIADKARDSEAAKAAWKGEINLAKSTGINTKALKLVDKLRRMEPRDAQSLVRDTVLYLRWLGLNILDQEDLLAVGSSTTGLTQHVISTHAVWEAGKAGYDAGKAGVPLDSNPFAPGTETHQRWVSEWRDGFEDGKGHAAPGGSIIQPKDHGTDNPEDAGESLL